MKKEEFRNFVKSIILEVKKEKTIETPYAETKSRRNNYLNGEKSKYKRNIDNKPSKTVHALLDKISRMVNPIDKNIECILDDHNDISVRLPGVFRIRIAPKWSGVYDVEAYRNMSDRIYAIALNDKQVMDFIRVNFVAAKKGYVQKAYNKSMENMKDKTEKKDKELPKTEPIKNKEVPDKEKEEPTKETGADQGAPMAVVDDPKRQEDYDVEKNKEMPKIQKMIKKEVDDDLTKNFKK